MSQIPDSSPSDSETLINLDSPLEQESDNDTISLTGTVIDAESNDSDSIDQPNTNNESVILDQQEDDDPSNQEEDSEELLINYYIPPLPSGFFLPSDKCLFRKRYPSKKWPPKNYLPIPRPDLCKSLKEISSLQEDKYYKTIILNYINTRIYESNKVQHNPNVRSFDASIESIERFPRATLETSVSSNCVINTEFRGNTGTLLPMLYATSGYLRTLRLKGFDKIPPGPVNQRPVTKSFIKRVRRRLGLDRAGQRVATSLGAICVVDSFDEDSENQMNCYYYDDYDDEEKKKTKEKEGKSECIGGEEEMTEPGIMGVIRNQLQVMLRAYNAFNGTKYPGTSVTLCNHGPMNKLHACIFKRRRGALGDGVAQGTTSTCGRNCGDGWHRNWKFCEGGSATGGGSNDTILKKENQQLQRLSLSEIIPSTCVPSCAHCDSTPSIAPPPWPSHQATQATTPYLATETYQNSGDGLLTDATVDNGLEICTGDSCATAQKKLRREDAPPPPPPPPSSPNSNDSLAGSDEDWIRSPGTMNSATIQDVLLLTEKTGPNQHVRFVLEPRKDDEHGTLALYLVHRPTGYIHLILFCVNQLIEERFNSDSLNLDALVDSDFTSGGLDVSMDLSESQEVETRRDVEADEFFFEEFELSDDDGGDDEQDGGYFLDEDFSKPLVEEEFLSHPEEGSFQKDVEDISQSQVQEIYGKITDKEVKEQEEYYEDPGFWEPPSDIDDYNDYNDYDTDGESFDESQNHDDDDDDDDGLDL
ncbi:uncharacterized protein SAPINGB_P005084 [Magnusiomyces paraingens]|uniref:Uncharacterized protein n=1 Tax=Magnusiomyces paraingens TaxID=2606893 RepID=A0A5E8C0S6_9ASCO|nr:uncharacterized protein SAPINGB_P005084 [Saprochaete ingens]VVT56475.1 unnamed protein product [Saprochaete ingens]